MPKFTCVLKVFALLSCTFILIPKKLTAQTEINVDIPKTISTVLLEFGFEHYRKETTSINHQLTFPGPFTNPNNIIKPFSFRYMNELRAYYPHAKNKPFVSLAQRLSYYPEFIDYELGFLLGLKFVSTLEPYNLQLKFGYTRSLNNQIENIRGGSSNNIIINFLVAFEL